MKLAILPTAGAALMLLGSLAVAQTSSPGMRSGNDGMSTNSSSGTGDRMDRGSGRSMSRDRMPSRGGGNPDNANGGNGPGGRY